VGDKGKEIIDLSERLSTLNPVEIPLYGWKGYKGGSPKDDCLLNGKWKLKFTTAADATFKESPIRGKAITSQEIDAEAGTLVNVIDFEKGKVKGFRVVINGEALSDNEVGLTFKRIEVFRNSRFPRIFGKLIIPLPSFRFLRSFGWLGSGRKTRSKGAFFELKYIDEDFRMHKTGDGNWFIQQKVSQ